MSPGGGAAFAAPAGRVHRRLLTARRRPPPRERSRRPRAPLLYGARGPLSLQRLTLTPDGRVCYAMKRPMHDGRTLLVLTPSEFLRKLATLVPPPRGHLVRFHGVFAPNASRRRAVVPTPDASEPATDTGPARPSRIPWAQLFKRVFKVDVLRCAKCGGDMKIVAFIEEPEAVRKVLDCLGLPTTGPPLAKARRRTEPDFDFAA